MYNFEKSPIYGLKIQIKDHRDAQAKAWWSLRKKIGKEPARKVWVAVDKMFKKNLIEFYETGTCKVGLNELLK